MIDPESPSRLYLIALWAYMRANPTADFRSFELVSERAAKLARVEP